MAAIHRCTNSDDRAMRWNAAAIAAASTYGSFVASPSTYFGHYGSVYVLADTPEGRAMRDYRAYILNIDGHRFVWAKEFQNSQPNDAAAFNAAKQLTDKHDVEVWEDSRLVARLSPGEGAGLVARLCPAEGLSPQLAPSPSSDCENSSPADGGEGVSPDLAPSSPSDCEKTSIGPAARISVRNRVTELALAIFRN